MSSGRLRIAAASSAAVLSFVCAFVQACSSASSDGAGSPDGAPSANGDSGNGGNNGENGSPGDASTRGDGTDGAATPASGDGGSAISDAALFPGFLPGTNLSGAEFGTVPGKPNFDYLYPNDDEVDEFIARGFKIFRFPFLWERMQPELGQPFDSAELARLTSIVSYATSKGAYAILDPHDYGRYSGQVIGSDASDDAGPAATSEQFGEFWGALAAQFEGDDHVVFGLMNEPNNEATETWLADANAAIAAIRAAGATNVIFVPGNGYTGAHDWDNPNAYGTPNGTVMLGVVDPLDHYLFEVHEYFDQYSSGTTPICGGTSSPSRFTDVTAWMRAHGKRAFLGEFATSTDPSCDGVLDDALTYIDQNRDVWAGWTWFSAGPLWGPYMFSIEPYADGGDHPQVAILQKHL